MGKKFLTLMMIPHNESRVREFRISRAALWGLSIALAASFCALVFYTVGYYLNLNREAQLSSLQVENTELTGHLEMLQGRLKDLRRGIDGLMEADRQMRALVDFSDPGEDVRKVGVGGLSQESAPWTERVTPEADALLSQTYAGLEQLIREARFLQASFSAISDSLQANRQLRDHTPSISPVPSDAECWISSDFGPRIDPFTGRKQFHNGIDLAGRRTTPILATADGVVEKVQWDRTLGWYVKLSHGSGYQTLYGHLQSKPSLAKGRAVKRGETIGRMGDSGRATATHVHYMVIRNKMALNPIKYIFGQRTLASIY